ncbi:alpha/beta fold hydrolase [Candidatus Binatus sp.]|jgi:pimeloyl-ACP methyl ester carboxylesterase|uniref:alpha/beta fold hydrolase n=1 Tax=Candidatus Binatus sp. TaxID=2811406 RepID=UPI003F9A51B8
MPELQHKYVNSNGIRMHYVEQGEGPLVILCHGWPESWYSWRHQIPALAAAGFRVVAPDQRGYGHTDAPEPIESYNIFNLVGDIVGLVNSLGVESAVIVGHDWGAPVAWNSALLRPDIFRAIALLSVPYFPRTPIRPTDAMKAMAGDQNFYQLYFQEPGKVEKELDADPRRSMAMVLYSASGDVPRTGEFSILFPKEKKFIETGIVPDKLPPWLTEADLDFFAGEFKRAGFRGGVNWYRNFDRNWELTPFLDGAKLRQPAVFAAGELDVVAKMIPGGYAMAGAFTPNLKKKVIIPGAGHWVQQERPKEINEILIEFLQG